MTMALLAALVLLVGCGVSPAAPEPTGFRDYPWGTPHEVMDRQLFSKVMSPMTCSWNWRTRGYATVSCLLPFFPEIPGESPVGVFYFAPDKTFGGYCIQVEGAAAMKALRAIATEKFGAGSSWSWRAATAAYEESHQTSVLCVEAKAYRAAIAAEESQAARSGAKRF